MKKRIVIFIAVLIGLWILGFIVFCHKIYTYPRDESTKTEAIIVLTGGRNRITVAGNLFNRQLAQKLFISGVNKTVSLDEIEKKNEIHLQKKTSVQIGKKAQNTIGNAEESMEWIHRNKIKSVRLVTSNYHIPRSLLEFQSRLPEVKLIAYPVYSNKVQKQWWHNRGSFVLLITEYNKFLYVWLNKKIRFLKELSL